MLIVVPTRGRPGNAARLIDAINQTTAARPRLHFVIDEDDPRRDDYLAVFDATHADGVVVTHEIGPRIFVGPSLNKVTCGTTDKWLWFAFMGDDHVPETQNWDLKLIEAAGRVGIAYGNDLIQGPNLPTAVVMTANLVRWLGYMVPPDLKHLYLDNFWKELGERLGILHYVPDVIIRHHHYQAGLAEHDQTYAEANSGQRWSEDGAAWERYRLMELPDVVERIRKLMNDVP